MEYEGTCTSILKKLVKLDGPLAYSNENAFLVPIEVFQALSKLVLLSTQLHENVREWNYNLQFGDEIEPMKLVWIFNLPQFISSFDVTIPGYIEPDIFNPDVKKAFSFLRPNYLQYMDKPFHNPNAITQVLLLLDYHRQQKRKYNIEIFNIFDLVAFKMAIDDNRIEYEHCEFHKLIEHTLNEMHKNKRYIRDKKLYLNDYLSDKWIIGLPNEKLDYLLYHFQHLIDYVSWKVFDPNDIKLSDIPSVPEFLKYLAKQSDHHLVQVSETDTIGNCANVLYDIVTQAKAPVKLEFKLDGKWIYTRNSDLIKNAPKTISACEFTIDTINSFNFVDHFISWLKFAFDKRCHVIKLMILNCKMMLPQTFKEFHFDSLSFFLIELNVNLIQMLKTCTYKNITFWRCRISNDIYERVELMGHQLGKDQNIFKYFEELDKVKYINLVLEEHTIGTIWAYVASKMTNDHLTEFKFKNRIQLVGRKVIYLNDLIFCLNVINEEFKQIDVFMHTSDGTRFDFYEFLCTNDLETSDLEEFDNNCVLYEKDDEFDFVQKFDGLKLSSDLDSLNFYN